MDNKKWYKRISTLFWFLLAILPFVIPLIQFIGYHLTFNSGISNASDLTSYHDNSIGQFDTILLKFINNWQNFGIPYIRDTFSSLFRHIGFSGNVATILYGSFSWFVSVYFFELMVDFVVWLPRMVHSWMNRWCND